MAGIDNLRTPSTDEARERGRKGGIASGEARRAKKTMQAIAEMVLAAPPPAGEGLEEQARAFGFDPTETNVQLVALLSVARNAIKGDIAAITFLRDTAGERPADKMNLAGNLNGSILITIGGEADSD